MPGDELGEGPSVELAAGSSEPRREAFGILKDIVGDRNSGFHTKSITAWQPLGKRKRERDRTWRNVYNTVRPHSSLGYRPPAPESHRPCPLESDPDSAVGKGLKLPQHCLARRPENTFGSYDKASSSYTAPPWHLGVPLGMAYDETAGAAGNTYDVYVSAKVTGPIYVADSTATENGFWVDRVVLVRTDSSD